MKRKAEENRVEVELNKIEVAGRTVKVRAIVETSSVKPCGLPATI